ncbi:MAG TPA: anion permease [Vicinamibacterales bacterium]
MSTPSAVIVPPAAPPTRRRPVGIRMLIPLAVGATILLLPAPEGLSPGAWRYFALFVAVIAGIIAEPIPAAAVGLVGLVVAGAFRMVRESPADSTSWAVSGFANATVWLVFTAYMLSLGYSQTGLGRRIALHLIKVLGQSPLGLGYAVTFADLALAPVTPSVTARSGATLYPVVRQIPELYDSRPNDPSARRIGAYLLYTAFAGSTVTSSMFMTAMAPNLLAVTLAAKIANVSISWTDWFIGFAPLGILLIAVLPAALYKLFPPRIKAAPEAPGWARAQLREMGPISRAEATLLGLISVALALWIGGGRFIDPTMVAMAVVALMVVLRVVTWAQVTGHAEAWNVLVWFAAVVALAGGLAETGLVTWMAESIAPALAGLGRYLTIVTLIGAFFFVHYLFASITAHTATLYAVFLAVGVQTGAATPKAWAMLLAFALGIMSILTSYASGQNPIYYGCGYIARRDFWVLGFVLGVTFFAAYMAIIVPWLAWLGI